MANGKAGGDWIHTWTYQGYRVHGGIFRRSPGLLPELGYVDLDYNDLKNLSVQVGPFWVGGGAGPKDIRAASSRSGPGQTTTAGGAGAGGGAGGGLKRVGDLVMQSSYKGQSMPAMVYQNIYVAEGGTEEITERISDARAHNKGKVRVQITDIRSTYRHGAFFGRINCRTASGKWCMATTKDGKGKPYTIQDVLKLLFSELPGSPSIHEQSVIFAAKFGGQPPYNMVGEGEPILHVLGQVLERYGLVARLLPDNNYFVGHELGGSYGPGQYAEDVGSPVQAEQIRREKKSISFSSNRSAAVMVVGKKRIRSITVPYVPVIRDPKSGRILPMTEANCSKLGTTLKDVKEQVYRNDEKSFRNVAPKGKREGFLRAAMFREWAFRVYAPAFAFDPNKKAGGGLLEEEFAELPFLPMHETAWVKADLEKHGIEPKFKKASGSGSLGDWILHPPVVWGASFRQGFFKDFEAVKEYFDMMVEAAKKTESFVEEQVTKLGKEIRDLGASLGKADREFQRRFSFGEAKSKYGLLGQKLGIGYQDDQAAAGREFGGGESAVAMSELMNKAAFDLLTKKQIAENGLKIWHDLSGKYLQETRRWKDEFEKFKKSFQGDEGLQAWANFPHGAMPEGSYSLDTQTGLIKFHDRTFQAKQPFLLQPDGAEVAADAAVLVTYGYELNFNILSDFTSVLFVGDDDAQATIADGVSSIPGVKICGVSRSCAIKPVVEKDPNIRLYENSAGDAFNMTEVVSAAAARACGQLQVPRAAVGYTYVLQGLRKAVLDDGISSVQHEWDGRIASTHVMVNAMGGRGPLGPPNLNANLKRGDADRRDDIGRAKEDR
jgi:hypothetical protein